MYLRYRTMYDNGIIDRVCTDEHAETLLKWTLNTSKEVAFEFLSRTAIERPEKQSTVKTKKQKKKKKKKNLGITSKQQPLPVHIGVVCTRSNV